jgi:glycosyltransferase involved in cell wall biosynthesis
VARRITLRGRLGPADLAEVRGRSGVFLMTSHSGYEGFPRVLVEAMATGLPAVVTDGSDTGGLVHQGVSGSSVVAVRASSPIPSAPPGTSTAPRSSTPSPR